MAKTRIPEKTQRALWARAGGRCQYRGCNRDLIGELLSGHEDKMFGFVAHIVADAPGGARGDPVLSPNLARDIGNLMLICADHHRLIDDEAPDDHPVDMLLDMKAEHENRLRLAGSIIPDRASHVIRFGANIGHNEALLSTKEIHASMAPDHYPASFQTIDLELIGSTLADHEPSYWVLQQMNLQRQFNDKVRGRIERQDIRHVSVFGLAPQPLLIELGRQIGDILPAAVHQRFREPSTWQWQLDQPRIHFEVRRASAGPNNVALVLALSATVQDERITSVLGADTAIWSVTALAPHNDILRDKADLAVFRGLLRRVLDEIKATHGENAVINVFPALPVAAAVEVGRIWMPKADLPMRIFDQNRRVGGFRPTLAISGAQALDEGLHRGLADAEARRVLPVDDAFRRVRAELNSNENS